MVFLPWIPDHELRALGLVIEILCFSFLIWNIRVNIVTMGLL